MRNDADSHPPLLLLSYSLIKVPLIALYYKKRLYRGRGGGVINFSSSAWASNVSCLFESAFCPPCP